jgi:hypothetical protein
MRNLDYYNCYLFFIYKFVGLNKRWFLNQIKEKHK